MLNWTHRKNTPQPGKFKPKSTLALNFKLLELMKAYGVVQDLTLFLLPFNLISWVGD